MKRMHRRCFLCDSKAFKNEPQECSFHRFPKDPDTEKQWRIFCKLSDTDDVSKLFLCSKHFEPKDFQEVDSDRSNTLPPSRNRLIPRAIPTVRKVVSRKIKRRNLHLIERDPLELPPSNLPKELHIEENQDPLAMETLIISPDLSEMKIEVIEHQPIENEKESDLDKRVVKLTRIVNQQRKKIKVLHQQKRRLLKRVCKYERIILGLREKNLLSEETGNNLMVLSFF